MRKLIATAYFRLHRDGPWLSDGVPFETDDANAADLVALNKARYAEETTMSTETAEPLVSQSQQHQPLRHSPRARARQQGRTIPAVRIDTIPSDE